MSETMDFGKIKSQLHKIYRELAKECESHVAKSECGDFGCCPYLQEDNPINDYCYLFDIKERVFQLEELIDDMTEFLEKQKCTNSSA